MLHDENMRRLSQADAHGPFWATVARLSSAAISSRVPNLGHELRTLLRPGGARHRLRCVRGVYLRIVGARGIN
jgi:hypothetical protein